MNHSESIISQIEELINLSKKTIKAELEVHIGFSKLLSFIHLFS